VIPKAYGYRGERLPLYFIKTDGTTWRFKDREIPSVLQNSVRAKEMDAFNGFLYILTDKGRIIRYSPFGTNGKWKELTVAGSDNRGIAASGQDLYVIKPNKSVYRYSEFILRR